MWNMEDSITEEELNDEVFWGQYKKDEEIWKENWIKRQLIGGNPWGYDPMTPKADVKELNEK